LVDWLLGLFGSSIVLCCACVLAVFLTEHGFGPFAAAAGLGMSRNLLHTWTPGGATKKLLARIEAYRLARR
jgi:hypothetical protein